MSDAPGELERLRRVVLEALMDHFAQERFTIGEFEEGVEKARSAESVSELKHLLTELPGA